MAIRSLDYAHAERRQRRYSHAPITTPVHREGEAWCVLTRLANAARKREVERLTCAACSFIDWSDCEATTAARAHADLCCGLDDECAWPGECVTHADPLVVALMVVV